MISIELVRVLFVDLDIEHVDVGEFLEQHALAFHDRLGRQRADVAKAQHGGAVGDHADQVAARRHFAHRFGFSWISSLAAATPGE